METHTEIPIWPPDAGGRPRRMTLISGAARWYLWMKEENQQAIATLRRDLLLLHQNGDLEMFKGSTVPSNGTYVTALHDGKMIRGRVCPSQANSNIQEEKKYSKQKVIPVIDLDEGEVVQLPLNQLRVLPLEMKRLACQAVRCDIGMDCVEQFDWPSQLNTMLLKALGSSLLLVENTATRPGSIPTISANITICNPTTGDSSSIQNFLLGRFTMHLDVCSMEKFKPFPVGNAHLMPQNLSTFHRPAVGMNFQSLPSNVLPLPFHVPGMPLFPSPNMPQNFSNFPPNSSPFQNTGLSQGFVRPPNTKQANGGVSQHPFVQPYSPGSSSISVTSSIINFVAQSPMMGNKIHHDSSSPSNRSSSSLSSLALSEYDSAESTLSTCGIELQDHLLSKSSSENNVKIQEHVNKPSKSVEKIITPETLMKASYKDTKSSQSSSSVEVSVEQLQTSSSSSHEEKGNRLDMTDCSSSLSADAPPFIPWNRRSALNAESETFVPRNKNHSPSPEDPSNVHHRKTKLAQVPCAEAPEFVPRNNITSPSAKAPEFVPRNKSTAPSAEAPAFIPSKKSVAASAEAPPSVSRNKSKELDAAPIRSNSVQNNVALNGTNKELPQSSLPSQKKSVTLPSHKDTVSTERKDHSEPQQPSCSSSHTFPKGPDVELPQVVRKWKIGQIVPAVIARVWNPSCFEVNVVDEFCELLQRILEEMEEYYKSHKILLSSKQQASELCGHFCACYDDDEGIWFRAEVDEWFLDDSVTPLRVWAVDYGGFSRVDLGCIQPLSSELACTSPRLITLCSMRNIQPRSEEDIWPEVHLNRVKKLLPEGQEMYLRIDGDSSEEFIWPVSVFTEASASMQSINEVLVAEGCAHYVGCAPNKNKKTITAVDEFYEDADNPMEEAYAIGGNNYDVDDEDACVAVSGWKPTEEAGICWFYNREGYCYKNYCELRHVRLNPDGSTIEKRELHTSSFEDLNDLLSPGNTINIIVTRILTVNHFMASIKFKKGSIKSRETLASVLENLNSTEMKRSLKTFTEFPADGEIVIFKDSKSNMFFRGRILNSSSKDDDDMYQVLNVDNGYIRKVSLKDLRRVDPAFLHHPFQAVECWLADVAPTQSDREWTKTCNAVFADMAANTKLSATIIRSSPWGIEVNLMDKDGNDIALMLKEMGILRSCPMRHLPLPGSLQIPG